MLFQLIAASKFIVECRVVSTAFLHGDRSEQKRDIYGEHPKERRDSLGLTLYDILKFEGSVYGLRTAPRAWYIRVRNDLETLGWRVHQLYACVFMKFCPAGNLI